MAGISSAERLSSGERRARLGVAILSVLGVADSLYMLSHTGGLVESLFCPFFGKGCDIVGESEHAKHLGIPNSAVGAVGYAVMGSLALWAGDRPPERQPWQPLGLAAASISAVAASVFLTWKQAALVKSWCFWCLSSAAINLLILPIALRDGLRALKGLGIRG